MSCRDPQHPHVHNQGFKIQWTIYWKHLYLIQDLHWQVITGMGSFDRDEGQHFFSFIPGARLLIHVHMPFTSFYSISFLLKVIKV